MRTGPDSVRQTQSYYDHLSRWYDLLSGPAERKHALAGLDCLDLRPGERALEIGFGTGHALVEMADRVGAGGRVTGLDLSWGMVGVAAARLRQSRWMDTVDLVCGDARDLPIRAGSMAAVFLSFTLELFAPAELPQVLGECRRILFPGGRIGVVSLHKPDRTHVGVAVYEWFHHRFPRAIDCRPIRAAEWVSQAGFEIQATYQPDLMGILPLEIVIASWPGP